MDGRDVHPWMGTHEVVPGGFHGGAGMSFYHWQPPKAEDYSSDEEFQEALSEWEDAEDTYIEDYLERRREERENN